MTPDSYNPYELGLIGWCLRSGSDFGPLIKQVRTKFFSDMQAVTLWPYLLEIWTAYGEWPTEAEAIHHLNQRLAANPLRPVYVDYLKSCYSAPVSQFTGAELKKWVMSRELLELSAKLSDFSNQISNASPEEQEMHLNELKMDFEAAVSVIEEPDDSDDFEPLHPDSLRKLEEDPDSDWGAPPLPTGFARLDAKIKDGGVRPYGVMLFGPTGGGKTMVATNIVMYAVSQGKRGVYISFDDPKNDLRDRIYSFMLGEEVEFEVLREQGRLAEVLGEVEEIKNESFPGRIIIKTLDPERYTPSDLVRLIKQTQTRLENEDRAAGVPEAECGNIDFVLVDTGDQVKAETKYKSEWYEVGKTHQLICTIPNKFQCPVYVVCQGGQQTIGAAQLTERDVGEGFAKTKPYKLILGIAQTAAQYHTDMVIPLAEPLIQDNLHNMHNYFLGGDRDTLWKPFTLCLIKNTRGRSKSGSANKVRLPMLINYGTCRVLENYLEPEMALTSPLQTQRDEAEGNPTTAPIRRKRKVVVH